MLKPALLRNPCCSDCLSSWTSYLLGGILVAAQTLKSEFFLGPIHSELGVLIPHDQGGPRIGERMARKGKKAKPMLGRSGLSPRLENRDSDSCVVLSAEDLS